MFVGLGLESRGRKIQLLLNWQSQQGALWLFSITYLLIFNIILCNFICYSFIIISYIILWVKVLILIEMMFICLNYNCEWIHFVLFAVVLFLYFHHTFVVSFSPVVFQKESNVMKIMTSHLSLPLWQAKRRNWKMSFSLNIVTFHTHVCHHFFFL